MIDKDFLIEIARAIREQNEKARKRAEASKELNGLGAFYSRGGRKARGWWLDGAYLGANATDAIEKLIQVSSR